MELRDVRRLSAVGIADAVGYDISGARPGVHIGVPSPTVTVVVDLLDGLELSGPGLSTPTRYRICTAGLHTSAFHIHHDGAQRGVQLELTPEAVRLMFGRPVAELAAGPIELTELGPFGSVYEEAATAGPQRGAAVVAATLADSAAPGEHGRTPHPDAARTWHEIAKCRGRITVRQLTERSGWSARYLATHFAREYGLSLKEAARLHRFHHARVALEAGLPATQVAADRGYADQAHLSREFRDFLGVSPSRYLTHRATEFEPATAH